ncbi:MAG TPA: RNA polymerase sigma factor [Chitinophagales bacterium]|nr:RNA polymerase sigma factor [Chitinophagales bacterium]HMU98125.1 RNA polymerase sigma factor [Chitinophagales bacterium]HMV02998.1 RNA polymerase sigma factor [Chitinophagales bacterium]HMW94537.1 RNA polymerase sigma factor [Chitinophagales bacterium]HMY42768.1 RNA polymerase sigma factor [Chitinophagales bacterium]
MMSNVFNNKVSEARGVLKPFAIKLTRDITDAEDLVQETVYKAIVNYEKFQTGTNLKAWLYTIMKNIFINDYRKKVSRNVIVDNTPNAYLLNSSITISNNAERAFVMEDINLALQKISAELRVPFLMHYKGYKYKEIADKLNLPLGTVKSRIFFARKDLAQILEKDYR